MGGDCAPQNTIEGAVLALKEYPYIEKLFLVGDAIATGNELKRLDFKDARDRDFPRLGSCLDEGVGSKGGPPQEGRVDLSCGRSCQKWIGSRGSFRGTHRGSRGGLCPQTPDAERNRPAGHCLLAADTEQSFRFDRRGSKPGLKPRKTWFSLRLWAPFFRRTSLATTTLQSR
jgi:hypothetical protein